MIKFRDLTPDDIEVRIQSVKEKGLVLLLYKNARVDMNILDETVGPESWQREHYECKGNLFCKVGIYCDTKEGVKAPGWIWKSDCGTESNTEAQKGEASDSFKRACFNWGIGRELYTSPFLWVDADNCNIKESTDRNGKKIFTCYDKFEVTKIVIEDKKITALAVWNTTQKKRVIVWQKPEQN